MWLVLVKRDSTQQEQTWNHDLDLLMDKPSVLKPSMNHGIDLFMMVPLMIVKSMLVDDAQWLRMVTMKVTLFLP